MVRSFLLTIRVSISRIQDFLLSVSKKPTLVVGSSIENGLIVRYENATLSWNRSPEVIGEKVHYPLRNISFKIAPGQLTAIVGSVGSGKSSLLLSMISEPTLIEGSYDIASSKIAYCSQVPWVLAGSIKENIVFGNEFKPDYFNLVVEACALKDDLDGFAKGAQTMIGVIFLFDLRNAVLRLVEVKRLGLPLLAPFTHLLIFFSLTIR